MTEKGNKVWKIFKKVIKILLGFIGVHEEVVNNEKENENGR